MGGYVGTKAVNLSTTAADVSGDANISGSITASGGTFSGDVDFGANKITYANVYAQLSDLPSASTYHGMFAHVHATGKAYFAHAGAWVPLTSGLGINDNADATAITIDSSENVGIGGTSPASYGKFLVEGTGNLINANASSGAATLQLYEGGAGRFGITTLNGSAGAKFTTAGTERVRLDASGNLLVGKTSSAFGTAGIEVQGDGELISTRAGTTAHFNRLSSNGDILQFYKDGALSGSVGANGSTLYIGSPEGGDAHLGFGNQIIRPVTSSGASRDAAIDLGYTGMRFRDAYLSGGVYLGGTGSSNYLEDYEEGAWSPTAGAGTITVIDTPTYTKVGRWVYLTAVVTMPTQTNSSQARITGLPFVPKQNGSNSEYGASIGEHNYGSYIEMSVHSGYPAIILRPNGGSSASYTTVSGKNFRFSIAYLTNQ